MLSQLSARTSTRNLSFLKPNIQVNLSSFNPMRQLRQQQNQGEEERTGSGGVAAFTETRVTVGERSDEGGASLRRRSADLNMSHRDEASESDDGREGATGVEVNGEAQPPLEGRDKPGAAEAGSRQKVMVRLKKDWQEISLDSCGILATSPTHLLVSSFKWDKTVRRSLDLDVDVGDKGARSTAVERAQPSPRLVFAAAEKDADLDARLQAEAKAVTPGAGSADVFDADEGGVSDRNSAVPCSGSSSLPDSSDVKARRLRRSNSAEDVSGHAGDLPSDEDSYCVLDEAEVAAILHKTQQLQRPHMKTSLSDNALTLQQQRGAQDSVSVTSSESSPFSRLKVKMSTLTVLRSSSAKGQDNMLSISKSHIRKSQRAMEVFERLVREKLRGSECQSRIIFI